MHVPKVLAWSSTLRLLSEPAAAKTGKRDQHLQLTALASNPEGNARFQCWEIATPFSTYPTVGKYIPSLANTSSVTYVVLPPHSDEGLHKPPHAMYACHL